MRLIEQAISLAELREMAEGGFGDLVKAVVDVERGVMAVDAEMHSDEEAELLRRGSTQDALWGINLYPDQEGDAFIEFDSMMANIGSEVFRTISWRDRNGDYGRNALYRALELLDLTVEDPKNTDRLKEILRVREALVDYFMYDNEYQSTDEQWQKYFHQFNLAANRDR
jgi:Protein of unknown function (DUF5674)